MINVLIVEDDPMVAELNKRYVERVQGFKVAAVASDGEKALKLLESLQINLMILDIYMPGLDGIALMEEMRKNMKSAYVDVIFVTAAKEVSEIDKALKLGAVDYLIKPFDGDRIKKALNNYLIRYNIINGKDTLGQEDIDKITYAAKNTEINEMDKGIHRNTLRRIREFMEEYHDCFMTSEEVAEKMGLSKVTVRRYLEFLADKGEVSTEVEYGSVGRPSYLYKSIR